MSPDSIVMHELTAAQAKRFMRLPAHALLVIGATGIGKQFLCQYIAGQLINGDVTQYAYMSYVEPEKDKSGIGIESIRSLHHLLKLRLPANAPWRIIIVPQAHKLTVEAQNGLLKLLEEPPERTVFMLASDSEYSVLPTIRSRSQQLTVRTPSQEDLAKFFSTTYETSTVQQAYLMSGGLPGLMHSLLSHQDHPLKNAVQTARRLLQSTQFERLCDVESLAKDRQTALHVIFVLQHMARAATAQSAKTADSNAVKRIQQWHRVHQAAYDAQQAYNVSAQAKLTLTNLMLSL